MSGLLGTPAHIADQTHWTSACCPGLAAFFLFCPRGQTRASIPFLRQPGSLLKTPDFQTLVLHKRGSC